jgi:hypothetical protein
VIHLAVLVLALGAFVALAFGMKRHQRDLAGRPLGPAASRLATTIGWLLLALAWALEAALLGPALGSIAWIGEISVAAWLAVAVITWRATRKGR